MTDIVVSTTNVQAEDRSWDLTPPHGEFRQQVVLDVSLFNASHYVNGYIPAGTIIGIKTTGGKGAPYLDSLSDGTNIAKGILVASVQVKRLDGTTRTLVGAALMVHGMVSVAALPWTSAQTAGGFIDAAGKVDLPMIYFAA